MWHVYTWWNSLETTLVTRSLLFVAPGCRLAELSDCEFVLHVLRVSTDLLLCVVSSISRTMLTGPELISKSSSSPCGMLRRRMSPSIPTGFMS